jgi:hypothetical protein
VIEMGYANLALLVIGVAMLTVGAMGLLTRLGLRPGDRR